MKYILTPSGEEVLRRNLEGEVSTLSPIDMAIMLKCWNREADIADIFNACRPYRDRKGNRKWADPMKILDSIKDLEMTGMIEIVR